MTSDSTSDFCPYLGLAPFDRSHQDYYFGRDLDAATLVDNVLHAPTTVLYGPSGVGKSSLINVGLPKALAHRRRGVRLVVFRHWQEPDAHAALIRAVAEAMGQPAGHDDLYGVLRMAVEAGSGPGPLVIVLDQFEEYFAYRPDRRDEGLEAALDRIAADDRLGVRLLFAMREDRYHLLDGLRAAIPPILDNTLELDHLDDDGVRDAIAKPLAVYNEHHRAGRPPIPPPGITERLIADLRNADTGSGKAAAERRIELPYLQLALEKIWKAAGGAGMRSLDDGFPEDRRIGLILADHLDGVMEQLTPERRTLAARVFDRLVTRSGAKFAVSAFDLADPEHGLPEDAIREVLSRLSLQDARILTPVARHDADQPFEIFHDVLGPPMLRWKDRFDAAEAEAAEKRRLTEAAAVERRRFHLALAAGIVMAGLATAAGAAGYIAVQFGKEAGAARNEAEQRFAEASAALIWSRLDAEDVLTEDVSAALWDLAGADRRVRQEFLAQLPGNGMHIDKFGAHASQIVSTFGLRPTTQDVAQLSGVFIDALNGGAGRGRYSQLWQIFSALTPRIPTELVPGLLDHLVDAPIQDVQTLAMRRLDPGLRSLPGKVSEDSMAKVLRTFMKVDYSRSSIYYIRGGRFDEFGGNEEIIRAFAERAPISIINELINEINNARYKEIIRFSAVGSEIIVRSYNKVSAEQSSYAVNNVLREFYENEFLHTSEFDLVLEALARRLDRVTAENIVRRMIGGEEDSQVNQIVRLYPKFFTALSSVLTADEKQRIIDVLFRFVDRKLNLFSFQEVDKIIELAIQCQEEVSIRVARQLSKYENLFEKYSFSSEAVTRLFEKISYTPIADIMDRIKEGDVFAAISRNRYAGVYFSHNIKALTDQEIRKIISTYINRYVSSDLVADDGVDFFIDQVSKAHPYIAAMIASEALSTYGYDRETGSVALQNTMKFLHFGISDEQKNLHYENILRRIRDEGARATSVANSVAILQGIAPKLTDDQIIPLLEASKARLAYLVDDLGPKEWADTIETLVRRYPDEAYVAALVEILKYPTAAGEPTDLLLTRLRERFPPVAALPDGDLAAVVAWIAATYPKIDLDSPPKRPPWPGADGARRAG